MLGVYMDSRGKGNGEIPCKVRLNSSGMPVDIELPWLVWEESTDVTDLRSSSCHVSNGVEAKREVIRVLPPLCAYWRLAGRCVNGDKEKTQTAPGEADSNDSWIPVYNKKVTDLECHRGNIVPDKRLSCGKPKFCPEGSLFISRATKSDVSLRRDCLAPWGPGLLNCCNADSPVVKLGTQQTGPACKALFICVGIVLGGPCLQRLHVDS
ncbi:hypothetical protein AK812_SmicGene8864 [Symbiodinium microadriaticum]|uniref:Uncharacterized protein n=1 Tax=Symbiodinium microadriaticum TaxID=2951 RepID=A0A1Q9EJR8_SYMMI|nr:hypothetical protein AK812_SmicGene8864 [Symbiodinium microadriaticum]